MYPYKGNRARSWAALVLLFACFLSQAMPWPAHTRTAAGGEAAAASIPVPQARETCPHHPEGCPPDCLCPKDRIDESPAASEFPSGPALSRCAGKTLSDAPVPCGLFLTEQSIGADRPDPFRYLLPPAPSAPTPGFRAESGKIPIA